LLIKERSKLIYDFYLEKFTIDYRRRLRIKRFKLPLKLKQIFPFFSKKRRWTVLEMLCAAEMMMMRAPPELVFNPELFTAD